MIPFLSIDANWHAADRIISSWIGTPYRHIWCRKQRGVDCGLFVGAVLEELAILTKVEFNFYPEQWFVHSSGLDVVKDIFATNIKNNLVPGFTLRSFPVESFQDENQFMRGDILGFSTMKVPSKITNHTCLLLDPPKNFVHCIRGRGVSPMQFGNFWIKKLTMIFRVERE